MLFPEDDILLWRKNIIVISYLPKSDETTMSYELQPACYNCSIFVSGFQALRKPFFAKKSHGLNFYDALIV